MTVKHSLRVACFILFVSAACSFVIPGDPQRGLPAKQTVYGTRRQPGLVGSGVNEQLPLEYTLAGGDWMPQAARWLGAGVVAGLLAAALSATPAEAYNTPILGKANWEHEVVKGNLAIESNRPKLEPCSKSKKYAKRIKDILYKVQQRQAKYPEGSVVYNRFVEKTASIKARQAAYGDRLCGKKDGLPHVLVDGTIRGGTFVPALMFFYITGWIGWAGRSYLIRTRSQEKELNMDVPLALTCMASGFAWPVLAWQAIVNGEMAIKEEDLWRSSL